MDNNLLQMTQAVSTNVHSNIDNLIIKAEQEDLYRTGFMYEDRSPSYIGGVDPVFSAISGTGGTRSLLDMALKKYGKKAFNKIRNLIDYDRAVAMSVPEKSYFLQRGIDRMLKVVEPNVKKRDSIQKLIEKEDYEEYIAPFAKNVLNQLKKWIVLT